MSHLYFKMMHMVLHVNCCNMGGDSIGTLIGNGLIDHVLILNN
jgi:lipid-binding SYLF domain-containing protein